jgi:hypothetical protein
MPFFVREVATHEAVIPSISPLSDKLYRINTGSKPPHESLPLLVKFISSITFPFVFSPYSVYSNNMLPINLSPLPDGSPAQRNPNQDHTFIIIAKSPYQHRKTHFNHFLIRPLNRSHKQDNTATSDSNTKQYLIYPRQPAYILFLLKLRPLLFFPVFPKPRASSPLMTYRDGKRFSASH